MAADAQDGQSVDSRRWAMVPVERIGRPTRRDRHVGVGIVQNPAFAFKLDDTGRQWLSLTGSRFVTRRCHVLQF